jgi:putative protease
MSEQAAEQEVGVVTHFFNHINVGAIEITGGELAVGDTIHVKGHSDDFTMKIESMQVDHQEAQTASTGQSVGIKVPSRVHEHDKVYKVVTD